MNFATSWAQTPAKG